MWHGGNDTSSPGATGGWRWGSWRLPPEHAPLLVGLCCGIAVIVLALSAVIIWRCCLLPKRKNDYCEKAFGEVTPQSGTNCSLSMPRDSAVYALRNGQWGYHSRLVERTSTIYRSATMASMPVHTCGVHDAMARKKNYRPSSQSINKDLIVSFPTPVMSQFQVPVSRENIHCHYLETEDLDSSLPARARSKSTPALEDLYAKVNFSKKLRNRMRKDEAAIIALSKSRSGHDSDSLALAGTAVVVYNERTAL